MDFNDGLNNVPVLPQGPGFQECTPTQDGTQVTEEWLNSLNYELMHVITEAGVTPEKFDPNTASSWQQVLRAVYLHIAGRSFGVWSTDYATLTGYTHPTQVIGSDGGVYISTGPGADLTQNPVGNGGVDWLQITFQNATQAAYGFMRYANTGEAGTNVNLLGLSPRTLRNSMQRSLVVDTLTGDPDGGASGFEFDTLGNAIDSLPPGSRGTVVLNQDTVLDEIIRAYDKDVIIQGADRFTKLVRPHNTDGVIFGRYANIKFQRITLEFGDSTNANDVLKNFVLLGDYSTLTLGQFSNDPLNTFVTVNALAGSLQHFYGGGAGNRISMVGSELNGSAPGHQFYDDTDVPMMTYRDGVTISNFSVRTNGWYGT